MTPTPPHVLTYRGVLQPLEPGGDGSYAAGGWMLITTDPSPSSHTPRMGPLSVAIQFRDAALQQGSDPLDQLGISPQQYVLATVHRAENTDSPERLATILTALDRLAEEMPVILPLHPRTSLRLDSSRVEHMTIIDPVGYLKIVLLESQAAVICTDSGGVQKEAYFHRVPCVTLRDETEWTELIDLGWNRLAPPESVENIVSAVDAARTDRPGDEASPYGDGHAAEQLVEVLADRYRR